MIRNFLLTAIVFMWCQSTSAQCVLDNITVPSEVCREAALLIENNSNAVEYEWDMCPIDLQSVPAVSKVMNTGLSSTIDLAIVRDEDRYFGFAVDASANSLVRLDFGTSPDNTPTKVDLGNIGGLFQFPNSVALVQQGNSWLGVVANASNEKVILLNFGNSLSNSPTGTILHSRGGGGFANIAIASVGGEGHALLIAEYNTRRVSVLNYPDGLLMPHNSQQSITIPGSAPIDIQAFEECGNWYAMVLSFDDRKLYRLDFGPSFLNLPALVTYGANLGFEPYRLSLAKEGDTRYGFISSTSGTLNRLTFAANINDDPSITPLGSFGVLSNSRSLFLEQAPQGRWRAFMINFSDGGLFRFSFQGNCGVSIPYLTQRSPSEIRYTSAGSKRIVVTAIDVDGRSLTSTYAITVTDKVAPQLTIESTNYCVNKEVSFRLQTTDVPISSYYWDFGDAETSSAESPSHIFSSTGDFEVSLMVTGENACANRAVKNVSIFEQPVSAFSIPSDGPACTNQVLKFVNTSTFQEGSQPYWRWYVNSVEISDDKDLSMAMSTVGPHTVKLLAGIPGCESTSENVLGPLTEGPQANFTLDSICFGQLTSFTNKSTGEISSFAWDFGDNTLSTQTSPDHRYATPGEHEVKLTAFGISGCNNFASQVIEIKFPPEVDFDAFGPPSACNGTPTTFNNKSSDPYGADVEWVWDFGDPHDVGQEREQHPKHVFAEAGTYLVALTATSEFGCFSRTIKEILIHESPSADFTYSTVCDARPITFSPSKRDNIAHTYWEIGTSYYYDPSPVHTFKTPGDFPVYLEVIGTNGCIAEQSSTIHVPVPLSPDFSVIKNCIDQEAIFTDITSGADPVVAQSWNFNPGGNFSGKQVAATFQNTGNISATLKVTGESGCSYETTRPVVILPAPHASFAATPSTGGYPLEVRFVNTSSDATHYLWSFANETSHEVSPIHTFREAGEFQVQLTAFNEQQCQHTTTNVITTVAPLPDADVELITLSENNDGTYRLIVTIHNKGNTYLRDLPVDIDFGGSLQLREVVEETIAPSSKYNLVLGTDILTPDILEYLCVSMDVHNDISTDGNQKCLRFDDDLYVFSAFPNPASEALTIKWISKTDKVLTISLFDRMGRLIASERRSSAIGLNYQDMVVANLESGIYFLLIDDGRTRHHERILISNNH